MNALKILGIDPGLNITGFGIIKIIGSEVPRLHIYGHIRTNSKHKLPDRIFKIFKELQQVISLEKPDMTAIENIFYAENVKTAISMGHARGAAMIASAIEKVPVFEYTPREIKMSLVGNGAASKSQVKFMVRSLLKLNEPIEPDDASDALATAICHWHRIKNQ